jgi:ABC-type sugar transport system substrate-binding protein
MSTTTLRRAIKKTVSIASVAALLAALASCGDDNDDSSGGPADGGGGDEAAVSAAQKVVDEGLEPQTLDVSTPLNEPPEEGKLAYLIRVNLEGTARFEEWTEILAQVGWEGRTLAVDPTDPQSFSNAMKQAVSAGADYITVHGQGVDQMKPGMDAARAEGVPVFFFNGNDVPKGEENWVFGNISEPRGIVHDVDLILSSFIADSNGTGDVLYAGYPDLPILALVEPMNQEEFKKDCPECTYNLLDLSTAQLNNGDAPNLIVSEIRKNPDIKYVATIVSFAFTGLRDALDAAGLNDVKIGISSAPNQWLDGVRAGEADFITVYPIGEALYACLDQLLRYDQGMDVEQEAHGVTPVQLYNQDTVGDTTEYDGPENFKEDYLKLWGVN